jgi:hypothetical protein
MDMNELSVHSAHLSISIAMDVYAAMLEEMQTRLRRQAKATDEASA